MKFNFSDLAQRLATMHLSHPLRVGINGVDGAGKTMFAKNLADHLRTCTDREIIIVSVYGFHNSQAIRYAKGRDSAAGFYEDSYSHANIIEFLLAPLGQGGDRQYLLESFDFDADRPTARNLRLASEDAILLFEGIFIFRSELNSYLDFRIFLDVPFDQTLQRMLIRDSDRTASSDEAIARFKTRYMAGQHIYLDAVHPEKLADIVIDNSDYKKPVIKQI